MLELAWIIPFLPLLSFVMIIFFIGGKEKLSSGFSISMILIDWIIAVVVLFQMLGRHGEPYEAYTLLTSFKTFNLELGILVDSLTAIMLVVVTTVGSCVQIYSLGYMKDDPRFTRFYAYVSLFLFSMLGLVLANNFFMIFIFWELVGLTSYLLIGFWFEKKSAADAGKKAFITTRVGDLGFIVGLMLIAAYCGTFNYGGVFEKAASGTVPAGVLTAAAIFIFCGAVGKSAQFPLHVWLPDAMEGPTPVSALIHAATMVTAGVYMVARCSIIYLQAPIAMEVVAIVGLATAVFAATMAITATDIKKVLAYSTVSQLGYMFLACGVGAFTAGVFHLMTHAFFKALLFLGAGSVMHALSGETQITKMGGLKKLTPTTFWTFLVAGLAIAGIPGLSGFFSKDEILWKTFLHSPVLYVIALIAAGVTAFYMFRMIFSVFYGTPRMDAAVMHHLHESPKVMTVPLMILAVLSIIGGYVGIPHLNQFEHWLDPVFTRFVPAGAALPSEAHGSFGLELGLMALSVIVALVGIYIAYQIYLVKIGAADRMATSFSGIYNLLKHKWYVDEIYEALFVRPLLWLSENFFWKIFDVKIIDGIVNGVANFLGGLASVLRRWQTGIVQNYAVTVVLGVIILLGYLLAR